MDKVRVYELARELGITSPETIKLLKEKLKLRVKSASSTIEEDMAIKLKRLIRLEGKVGLTNKKKQEEDKASDPASSARAARKQRIEKARLAVLQEMEEEDRAREEKARKDQEEQERKEAEAIAAEAERQRIAAEQAAEEEAARAAAALAVEMGVPDQNIVTRPEVFDGTTAAAAITGSVETVSIGPVKEERSADSSDSLAMTEVAQSHSSGAQALPKEERGKTPTSLTQKSAIPDSSGQRTSARSFAPGPTSTYIRTQQPASNRPGQIKSVPSPPRPAAPIKTVTKRRPDAKPKPKSGRRTREVPTIDVTEDILPEPHPRVEEPKREPPKITRKIALSEGVTVKELAEKLEAKHKDVIKILMSRGVLATINQTLDGDTAQEVAREFGAEAEILSFEEDALREEQMEEKQEDLIARAPVVTVMGHVDHGKTSLLDAIRETKVVEKEAGGITQHVGAYKVDVGERSVVFLDTPGHEAFTMMRARGAKVTDLVILVVAADDGVMPQTLEAVDHARAAGVPLMVAVNKIDKPDANPDRVKKQLADLELVPEDWGGTIVFVPVSAKKREGLDLLLEMILLVSDLQELKANPDRAGTGTVVEAKLDKGKGSVAHVLVQNGSVSVGDSFVAGAVYGKVRAMLDDRGNKVKTVGPATPVEILGLTSLPEAGDQFQVFTDAFKARQIGEYRQQRLRERQLASSARLSLDQLHQQVEEGTIKELPIVLKADVQGSVEVLRDTLTKLSTEKVKVKIIGAGAGAISEMDVLLASASNAVIIGFNVRPQRSAVDLAGKENIDIRLHTVIYNVTDELKKAMTGLLEPTFKEAVLGRAEVREVFRVPKVGVIAGCYVLEGKIHRGAELRLLRDDVVIYEGKNSSLKRFKEDVSEVKDGFECGIGLANYNDIKARDVIEAFTMEKVEQSEKD